ncbi:MAG TPA: hypothetical protein VN442_24975 [Bryobacteraceae bacterium]|nr:hypothetical protein [Bryobacteraceae bacterium]
MTKPSLKPLTTGITLLAALAYLAVGMGRGLYPYDEGIIAHGAERVLAGAVPYLDFWSAYSPGQFYLLAGLYKVFGPGLMVGRIYTLAAEFAIVVFAFLLSRRFSARTGSLVACALVAIWLGYAGRPLYPAIPAMALALAGFCLIGRPSISFHALAGMMAGGALLLRHDLGVYALPPQLLAIAAYAWLDPHAQKDTHPPFARVFRLLLAYAAGASLFVLPATVAIFSKVPFGLLHEIFIIFPLRDYAKIRALPAPPPGLDVESLACLLPFVLVGAAVLAVLFSLGRRHTLPGYSGAAGLTLFGLALLLTARVRPDVEHMAAPMIAVLIVLPWVIGRLHPAAGALLILPCILLFLQCLLGKVILSSLPTRPVHLERAAGIYVGFEPDGLEEAVRYIRRNTTDGERIFVGNARHDRIFINHALFYFLSGRTSATRCHELLPGVATTAAMQHEIVSEIQRYRVRYIVLWLAPQGHEPNQSSETGATVLDDWIRSHCKEVGRFGDFAILRRVGT